jgi:ribosome assembly protein YihI (activator of Der GTPase)
MLPVGLTYVDSWVDERLDRCFQLMETNDLSLFDDWIAGWDDLVEFEVVPVLDSAEAGARALA